MPPPSSLVCIVQLLLSASVTLGLLPHRVIE